MTGFMLQASAAAVGAFVGVTGGYYWTRWSSTRNTKKIAAEIHQMRQHQRSFQDGLDSISRDPGRGEPPL